MDFESAIDWYESQEPGLGTKFELAVDVVLDMIAHNPEVGRVMVEPYVRRGLLQRFPYSVYYVILGPKIHVLALLHTSRDQHHLMRRLPK